MSDSLSILCPELQAHIFAWLTINDLAQTVAQVCKSWNKLAKSAFFRRTLLISSRHIRFVVNQDYVMRQLVLNSPLLSDLRMNNMNVKSLLPLVGEYCPKLRRLTLTDCVRLDALRILIHKCPDLEYLSLGRLCSNRLCTKCIELCLRIADIKKLKYLQINDEKLVHNVHNDIIDYILAFCMRIFCTECLLQGGAARVGEAIRIIATNTQQPQQQQSDSLKKAVDGLLSSAKLLCLEN